MGLISHHRPARGNLKRKLSKSPVYAGLLFLEEIMDIVSAVKEYSKLLNVEYHLILGRKNKAKNIRIIFDDTSWFHVAGLHYLKDIGINHDKIALKPFFDGIILGNINEEYFRKSKYYDSILDRVDLLSRLDTIIEGIDNTNICIYGFDKKKAAFFTKIDGDYLISDLRKADNPVNLFLVFERKDDGTLVPVSAFHPEINAKTGKPLDYTDRQMRYTLLKNTRREISEDKYTEVFRHLNYKE